MTNIFLILWFILCVSVPLWQTIIQSLTFETPIEKLDSSSNPCLKAGAISPIRSSTCSSILLYLCSSVVAFLPRPLNHDKLVILVISVAHVIAVSHKKGDNTEE